MAEQYGPSGERQYGNDGKIISRDKPQPDEARMASVKKWTEAVKRRRDYLAEHEFKKIREDMDFCEGYQINHGGVMKTAEEADEYVANLCISHVNDRVNSLYAKNPKAIAKRVDRMDSPLWDGKAESAQQVDMRMAQDTMTKGMPDPNDVAFMRAVGEVITRRKMIDDIGRTLVILFNYFLREGQPVFKTSAKQLVRRVETAGVGYIKLGFQRAMTVSKETEAKIADFSDQLKRIETMAADLADEEVQDNSAEAEDLNLAISAMQQQTDVVAREGLVFDFPDATAVIPGPGCKHIRGFVGAPWIAEEHIVSPDEIKDRFGCDIGNEYTQYKPTAAGDDPDDMKCRWWEIYDLKTGVLRHIIEGYCEYLEEPKPNPVFFEQGHPYFALTFNNLESQKTCMPPSDVRLMRPMQKEINRAEEGIREHRVASRPGYLAGVGTMDEKDKNWFEIRVPHEIGFLKIPPGTKTADVLGQIPTAPIDPQMYETERHVINITRVVKTQESNFGGAQGDVTATETTRATQVQSVNTSSNVDDLDDFLTAVAKASGQVLLDQMHAEQVQKIAGAGAVWPSLSRQEIAEEVFLEIKAGSSGAPNVALELANFERVAPTLLQVPGVQPKKVAGYMLERLETGVDLDEWITEGLPSITAMNSMVKAPAPPGGSGDDPNAQGDQGGNNKAKGPAAEAAQPIFPAPGGPQIMPPAGPIQ